MNNFETTYKQLNARQREAVDTIDGPLLVIAGPGTGKTQLLSARVANILQKTDTDPSSILCLTFTNKAANNMRERLMSLVGSSAQRVVVKTFHAFAAEIMNRYPEHFWNGANLVIAPDAVQLEVIQSILSKLPLDNPLALKFAGQFTATSAVQDGLKLAKEAGLTPEKLRSIINYNVAYIDMIEPALVDMLKAPLSAKALGQLQDAIETLLDQKTDTDTVPLVSLATVIKEGLALALENDTGSGKTKHTGKWKARWVQNQDGNKGMFDERKRNAWWLALSGVYEQYRAALHSRGYYDYADMLVEVISQMEQHADLRASVQEQFLYVLIDEFQDTNAAQFRLAHLTAEHFSAGGRPNLMAVGDDDQAIYKFNGAELSNMLSFQRTYPSTKVLVLEESYRSSQAILDTAQKVIEQAENRLVHTKKELTKNLRSVRPPREDGKIAHTIYPSRAQQLYSVAMTVKKEFKNSQKTIAILARGHDSLRQMAGQLLEQGVPVRYEQQSNILEDEAVKHILLISRCVQSIQDGDASATSHYLSQILRHPMWRINPDKLWEIAVESYEKSDWMSTLLHSQQPALRSIGEWFMQLAQLATAEPLPVFVEHVIGLRQIMEFASPFRTYYFNGHPTANNYIKTLSAVHLLRSLVEEFTNASNPTVGAFNEFIDVHIANHKIIADETPFVSNTRAVQLLTVHKAKGLEFDTVYLIDAIDTNWRPRLSGRKTPGNLPLRPPLDDADDYVRLLYVASTRPKQSLIITSYSHDEKGEDVLPSTVVTAAFNTVIEEPPVDPDHIVTMLENSFRWPRLENHAKENALLASRLEKFRLSATGLLQFLDLTHGGPEHFLERNLLRLPEAKSPHLAFGSAMHSALETAQRLTNNDGFDFELVKSSFTAALVRQHLPKSEYERYAQHGMSVLEDLFTKLSYSLPKDSLAEQSIHDVILGHARLTGKLDRIDPLGAKQLRIVDYKTGTPLPSLTTANQTLAVKAWRQRTQLIFYALLVRHSSRFAGITDVTGQMVYVEASTAKQLLRDYAPTNQEIERLEVLLQRVWERIMKLNMPKTDIYSLDMQGILQFEEDLLHK